MALGYTLIMWKRSVLWCCLFFLAGLALVSFGIPNQGSVSQRVEDIFSRMTTEEKIGQLFMVTFSGKDISPNSEIYQLISTYRVGSVLLDREKGNWHSGQGEAAAVLTLSNGLQQIENDAVGPQGASAGGEYLPLFIALPGGSDGYPDTQLITDLTNLPSEMTLGATWQPQLAQNTGAILGRELSLIGINLYLGPSLDVLERPNPGTTGDLGARTFGGDPFWVGEMGRAYIQGIHEGSQQKVAVIATHFPGIGASDRSPEEEVATIRKSLEDLRQIDLAPFAVAAVAAPGSAEIADGFLVSHIRYQGLTQGNIRASTKPVSLDPQALNQLMALPEFVNWRAGGGITVSDSLGTQSVRKFYDTSGMTFSNRGVALAALQAGNDILQLSNFQDPETGSELPTILDTIKYFQQEYQVDTDFADKVDQAVLRILTLKTRMYPFFSLDSAQPSAEALGGLKQDSGTTSDSCKAGVTLISPNLKATGGTIVEPPTSADRLVVLTDSRTVIPCPSCAVEADLSPGIMADTILRLYGPRASGLIAPTRIQSFTFKDLNSYLAGVPSPDLENALANATVILVLLRSPSLSLPDSYAFQKLLAQAPTLTRNKKVFVFALDAPYYLDSTEISKVDAYYGLYSKNDSCIETAARVLFGDFTPHGDSPVNIEGVGYDLLTALSPDPNQLIPISVELATPNATTPNPLTASPNKTTANPLTATPRTPTVSPVPLGFSLGDNLTLLAGPVMDHNQHLVPDGTLLQFIITYPAENIPPLYKSAPTKNGMAQANYFLDRQGEMQLSASSEPARNSVIIKLAIGEKPAFITAIAPTRSAEMTPSPKPTSNGSPQPTPPTGGGTERAGWDTFITVLLLLGILSGAIFAVTNTPAWNAFRWRSILGGLAGGLAGYDWIALGFPGTGGLTAWGGRWMCVLFGAIGSLMGVALAWWSIRRIRD
jgi:beta-N-acetylhexosaminidase